jgi:hypothetical protein
MHEHGAEVVVAVTEVVLEVIALVLEGVEGFVFDFPACAGSSISVLFELNLGQLRYCFAVVPPQPNHPLNSVFRFDRRGEAPPLS